MARLEICLLGSFQAALDGEPVTGFETLKVRALLAYLAVESDRAHQRAFLAEMLWPDRVEGAARTNLRHALGNLRNVIGEQKRAASQEKKPPFLSVTRETIQLHPGDDVWVDTAAFLDLLGGTTAKSRPGLDRLEEAIRLYRGPFLSGISVGDSASFHEWALVKREQFTRRVLIALRQLEKQYEARKQYRPALEHARRRAELAPWDEGAHQQVMRLLALVGERTGALAQYEACRRELKRELGVQPTAMTVQLYERIRNGNLDVPPVAPATIGGSAPGPRSPGFLERGARDVQPPVFVARDREMARLESFLRATLRGKGQVIFVTGGSGRGKSALLAEFGRRAMDAHPDLLYALGNCNAYSGVGDPYLPFCDLMDMLTGDVEARWLAGSVTTEQARRIWNGLPVVMQALLQHGPHVLQILLSGQGLLSRAAAAAGPSGAPWLEQLRGRVENRRPDSEGVEQSHLFQQLINVLQCLARTHPLLLILDDLQWADTATIGLLFHLGRRLAGERILVVGAYRAEDVALGRPLTSSGQLERHPLEKVLHEFKGAYGDIWLDLAEDDEPERRRLVDALLAIEPNRLGEDFNRVLAERTGGYPLFTIELLRSMQARGDLVQDDAGCWIEGPVLNWETLPARVEGVIQERVGRLEPDLREILSLASVEGERFTVQVLAQLLGCGERQLLRSLAQELHKRHRLVREQGSLTVGRRRLARFRFAHVLFQQYLYHALGEGERELLHQKIAAVLEKLYEGQLQAVAAQLAHHYSRAGDDKGSLKYHALAGDVALAKYANREAEEHYRRALSLAPEAFQRARLLSGLGYVLSRQSRFQEAIETWRQAIKLYQAMDDPGNVAALYARSAGAASSAGDLPESLRLCREGLVALSDGPESVGMALLLGETAAAYVNNSLMGQALPLCQAALEMAVRQGALDVQVKALALLGSCGLPPEESFKALSEAVELADKAGLLSEGARAHNSLGLHCIHMLADARTARDHGRQSAELFRQAGRTADQVSALAKVSVNSQRLGEFEEAQATLLQMRQLLGQISEPGRAAEQTRFCTIWLLGHKGEWTEAAALARALLADSRERDPVFLAGAAYLLGWSVLESHRLGTGVPAGEWAEAEAALAEAIEIADRLPYYLYRVDARAVLGSVYVCQSRLDEARRMLVESRARVDAQPAAWDGQSLLSLQAELTQAEERWSEAFSAFETLTGIYRRLGWRWRLARSLLASADVYLARGDPQDCGRARNLFLESRVIFEGMGISRLATLAAEREQALKAGA